MFIGENYLLAKRGSQVKSGLNLKEQYNVITGQEEKKKKRWGLPYWKLSRGGWRTISHECSCLDSLHEGETRLDGL